MTSVVVAQGGNIVAVGVDSRMRRVFWSNTDSALRGIYSTSVDGGDVTTIATRGANHVKVALILPKNYFYTYRGCVVRRVRSERSGDRLGFSSSLLDRRTTTSHSSCKLRRIAPENNYQERFDQPERNGYRHAQEVNSKFRTNQQIFTVK